MNANLVVEWIKSNVLIVVFVVLMFAAPIAMFILTGGMNEAVKTDVQARVQKDAELARLTVPIQLPNGQPKEGIVNERLLNDYSTVAEQISADAKAVQDAALTHNQKTREVAMAGVFPAMAATEREVLPPRFHDALVARYTQLLKDINAGSAPSAESLRQDIDLKRRTFITQDLRKVPTDQLTPDEQKRVSDELSKLRMSRYADAAKSVGVYADLSALPVPGFDRMRLPNESQMFAWQWEYWIVEDVLKALNEANKAHRSVTTAPVKRVVSISVRDVPQGQEAQPQSGGSEGGMGSLGGFGSMSGGESEPDPATQGAPAIPADPKAPIPPDYKISLSGRQSNPLYDVITVDLQLVVESASLPLLLDSIAKYNFMTVLNMSLSAADPFEAAAAGFYYGSKPVNTVHLQIETVWLRAWTKEFMPAATKKQLGIPDGQAPAEPSTT